MTQPQTSYQGQLPTQMQYPNQGPPMMNPNTQNPNQQYQNQFSQQPQMQQKTKNIPRPCHTSQGSIPKHDKYAFRKGSIQFPPPDTLYTAENTYDAGP